MTELDDAVRTMLRTRAQDITTLPPHLLDLYPVATSRRHSGVRWLVAAAAVAAAVLAVLVSAVPSSRRPAAPRPPAVVHTCSAPLPAAWNATVERAGIRAGGRDLQPLAIAADGSVLAARGSDPTAAAMSAVVVTPQRTVVSLLTLPRGQVVDAVPLAANRRWLVFATRSVSWTNDAVLWAVDRADGNAVRTVLDLTAAGATGGATLHDWLLLGDDVYYTVADRYAGSFDRLFRYDLRTHDVVQVGAGANLTMHSVYGSLSYRSHPSPAVWGRQVVVVAGNVPRGTPAAVTSGLYPVVSDGSAVGWLETASLPGRGARMTAYWWRPGAPAPVPAHVEATSTDPGATPAFQLDAVAGPYVIVRDNGQPVTRIVDTRTHATATLASTGLSQPWLSGPAGGGLLAVVSSRGKFGPNTLFLPKIADLPRLSCR